MLESMLMGRTSDGSPVGQILFSTAGTFEFIVPEDVNQICGVAVGASCGFGGSRGFGASAGAAGGGGPGLSWRNHIPVTPGEVLKVFIPPATTSAADGTDTYLARTVESVDEILLIAGGGKRGSGTTGGTGGLGGKFASSINDGGGSGGRGGNGGSAGINPGGGGGGGGAGGYTGAGGVGGNGGSGSGSSGGAGGAGLGGAARGGNGGSGGSSAGSGQAGNGVGLYGEYASGNTAAPNGSIPPTGDTTAYGRPNMSGAMRLLWGSNRQFPTTNVLDM